MKTYKVRMEFNVKSADFADIEVEASSEAEARQSAKTQYYNGELDDLNYYASDYLNSDLDTEYLEDWQVEEIKDNNG